MGRQEEGTIYAKVAKIINPNLLAINAGANSGVLVGDDVAIYATEAIFDPDTQELLNTIILTRLRLRISNVFERVSLASVTDRIGRGGTTLSIGLKPLRKMTHDPTSSDDWIQVTLGESIRITHPDPAPEEPPF